MKRYSTELRLSLKRCRGLPPRHRGPAAGCLGGEVGMRVMRSSSPGAQGQHEENVTGEPSTPGGPQPFLSGAQGSFPAEAGASPHPGLPSLHPLQGPHPQGVKKKTCTPNISRKIKEEPKEEVTIKKEKRERDTDKSVKGIQTDSERAMDRAGGAQKCSGPTPSLSRAQMI